MDGQEPCALDLISKLLPQGIRHHSRAGVESLIWPSISLPSGVLKAPPVATASATVSLALQLT